MSPVAGSVALWVQPLSFRDSTVPQYIFGYSTPDAWSNTIQLYTDDTDGTLDLGFAGVHQQEVALATLAAEQWQHLALTWNASTYRVYVNGILQAMGDHAGLAPFSPTADLGNTGRPTARNEGFNGLIDDVQLYSRELTAPEIWMRANPVSVPRPPRTVGAQP